MTAMKKPDHEEESVKLLFTIGAVLLALILAFFLAVALIIG